MTRPPETHPVRRMHRVRQRLLALAISGVLSFVACEIAVRILIGAPLAEHLPILTIQANEFRGWEMVPGEEHKTYHHLVHVNALGLRGPELGPKEPGEIRVLTLGDSLIYGQGAGDDETVPHVMEELLNEDAPEGHTYRVVNGGLRAYATNQELGLLRELGPTIRPDVVVLFWYWNDIVEPNIQSNYERFRRTGPVAFDIKRRMEGWPAFKWHLVQLVRHSALFMYLHDQKARFTDDSPAANPKLTEEGLARLAAHLDEFEALAAELGFRPVFAVIPDANSLTAYHPSEPLGERAAAIATEKGLPVILLIGTMRECYRRLGELPVIPYDWHYDARGNAALAHGVVGALRTLGLAQ